MPDALRRALRTFLQAFIGLFLALATTEHLAPGEVPDLNVLKRIALAAAWGATIALLTWLMNYLEDNTSLPAVLKQTPSGGQHPVTSDPAT